MVLTNRKSKLSDTDLDTTTNHESSKLQCVTKELEQEVKVTVYHTKINKVWF
jgi:hypothetical protein